jgi:hypothetical protein
LLRWKPLFKTQTHVEAFFPNKQFLILLLPLSPKNADPENRTRVSGERSDSFYFYLGLLVPLGEAVGGQGVPLDEVPAEFPVPLPDVEGEDVEGDPESEEPEPEAPVVPAVPGMVPHGEPLGVVPGAVVVFGFTVEGCVLLPGVAGFVELAPGTLEPAPGVAVPAGGVAV